MITTHLLNNTLTKDSDLSKLTESVMTSGVLNGLEVTAQSDTEITISPGVAFIQVQRTTTTPNEKFLVLVKLTEQMVVSENDVVGSFNHIGIQIPQNLINNPLEIVGQEIAEVINVDTEPDNFLSLAFFDGTRNDTRQQSKLTGLRVGLDSNSIFYSDSDGTEQSLSFIGQDNRIVQSLGSGGLGFTDVVISNTKTYTAGADLSTNDICSLNSAGEAIPYTSTDNVFIGMATSTVTAGSSIDIQIRGIVDGLSLTYGATYFVDASGNLTTTDTGNKVGRALSTTELLLEPQGF